MDDSDANLPEPPTPSSTLRRRNSIGASVVVPKKLFVLTTPVHSSGFEARPNGISRQTSTLTHSSSLDFELVSLKSPFSSYTSLRDVLPSTNSAVNSPTSASATISSGYEISIRNRLVKQAAWAYLQPMSACSQSSGPHFFRRLWQKFSSSRHNPITACLSFIYSHLIPGIARILDRILRAIRVQVSR
ncbi:putative COPII coat assembly protein SEC16 [Quillaja saponaria]|uniref:COPII coat assembly protein SEC16 n=1 Tax=Quillaja saponaria TaxID=32244 RepID=A0AAD7PYP5_QUISA|nr:putative COPII coat assembly protein SEC16 [Quillaja saponaria]